MGTKLIIKKRIIDAKFTQSTIEKTQGLVYRRFISRISKIRVFGVISRGDCLVLMLDYALNIMFDVSNNNQLIYLSKEESLPSNAKEYVIFDDNTKLCYFGDNALLVSDNMF